jgi:quercetin dioxygenase-like cupin family protein
VEGDRIQVGLMRMPKGTGSRPHSHPNEQWIYVMQGTLESEVAGVKSRAGSGSLIYIPANAVHSAMATPDADVIFLTAKDMTHGIAGTAVDSSVSGPAYARGFEPSR